MRRHLILFSLILLCLCVGAACGQNATPTPGDGTQPEDLKGVPSIAPDYQSDDRSLPDLGRVGVDMTTQRSLTLQEAVELALENNRDVELSRKSIRIAEFNIKAAKGAYQPRLIGQTYYDRSTTPNVSIFSNNQKTTLGSFVGNASIQGSLPVNGTVFTGTFNNSRTTTDNPISILSPQYNSSLGISLTQPLFRGRKFDPARYSIQIAKKNLELTDTQFRQRSIEVVASVEKAYWDLAYALRNLQVQRDAVRDAKEQLEHNRRLVDEGQLAPIDIVAAETQVANFEQAVYEALNLVNQAENVLKNLLSPVRTDQLWGEAITPVEPVDLNAPQTTLTQAMDEALANRPELEINQKQKDINALDQRLYRDQKKPQIDLIAGYTSAGIGGGQNPDFSPTFPTACTTDPNSPACAQQQANLAVLTGSPFRGVFANRYPTYRIGLQINLPLFGDKAAEAQLGRSLVEEEKLDVQREQIEQGIQVEVRNALQTIRTAEARLRSAAIARENSERQYESEKRKLDAGQSDIYKVLERQTALTAARSNELRAQTELNKAIAEYEHATGSTLKVRNIEVK